jgi:hypothetical protein
VANYNGHLLSLAGETPCPVNRLVMALISRMIARHLPAHPDRLAELWRAVRATPQSVGEMAGGVSIAG